jgi:hypothetical protein
MSASAFFLGVCAAGPVPVIGPGNRRKARELGLAGTDRAVAGASGTGAKKECQSEQEGRAETRHIITPPIFQRES